MFTPRTITTCADGCSKLSSVCFISISVTLARLSCCDLYQKKLTVHLPRDILKGCMDFQHVVSLCRKHRLFSALIYVYNQGNCCFYLLFKCDAQLAYACFSSCELGCDDYRTPIEEVMRLVLNPSQENNTVQSLSLVRSASFRSLTFLVQLSCQVLGWLWLQVTPIHSGVSGWEGLSQGTFFFPDVYANHSPDSSTFACCFLVFSLHKGDIPAARRPLVQAEVLAALFTRNPRVLSEPSFPSNLQFLKRKAGGRSFSSFILSI